MNSLPREIVSLIIDRVDDPSNAILVNSTWLDAWFDCEKFWRRVIVCAGDEKAACETLQNVRCPVRHLIIDEGISPDDIERILDVCRSYESLDVIAPFDGISTAVIRSPIATSLRLTVRDVPDLGGFDRLEIVRLHGVWGTVTTSQMPPGLRVLDISGYFAMHFDAPLRDLWKFAMHTDRGTIIDVDAMPALESLFVGGWSVRIAGRNSNVRVASVDASTFDSSDLFDRLPGLVRCSFTDGEIPPVLPPTLEHLDVSVKHAIETIARVDWSGCAALKYVRLCNVRCREIKFPDSLVSAVFRRCVVLSVAAPYFHLRFRIMWDASIRIDHERRKVVFRDANVIMPVDEMDL